MTLLAIGEVADRTGVAVTALRYYDEIGLISAAERVGGKRRFDEATVGRVNFVRRAQDAGFTLDQIRRILDDSHGEWRGLVDEQIARLTARRDQLDTLVEYLGEIRDCGCDVVARCQRTAMS